MQIKQFSNEADFILFSRKGAAFFSFYGKGSSYPHSSICLAKDAATALFFTRGNSQNSLNRAKKHAASLSRTQMGFTCICTKGNSRDRRPSTTDCPVCWAMGTHKVKKCAVRKQIFCTGSNIEQPRQDKNLLYRLEPNKTTKEGPLVTCTPRVSICHSFNIQQGGGGPPLSGLCGQHHRPSFGNV